MPYVLGGLAAILLGVVARIIHLIHKHTTSHEQNSKRVEIAMVPGHG